MQQPQAEPEVAIRWQLIGLAPVVVLVFTTCSAITLNLNADKSFPQTLSLINLNKDMIFNEPLLVVINFKLIRMSK